MKHILFLLLFLPVLAFAQYQPSPTKLRLGVQTTGDGLIYRSGGFPNYTPSTSNNAWFHFDTTAKKLYFFQGGTWQEFTSGGGGGSGTVTSITAGTGLTGGTITTAGTIAADTAGMLVSKSFLTNQGYTTNTGTVTSVGTGYGLTGGTITGAGTIVADSSKLATVYALQDTAAAIRGDFPTGGGGGVPGSGTANFVTKWSASDAITDSNIYDDGTNVGVNTTTPVAEFDIRGRKFHSVGGIDGTGIIASAISDIQYISDISQVEAYNYYGKVYHAVGDHEYGHYDYIMKSRTPDGDTRAPVVPGDQIYTRQFLADNGDINLAYAEERIIIADTSIGSFKANLYIDVRSGRPIDGGISIMGETARVGIWNKTPAYSLSFDTNVATDAIGVPGGTTAQRPTVELISGYPIRYNTDNAAMEYNAGAQWKTLTTGGVSITSTTLETSPITGVVGKITLVDCSAAARIVAPPSSPTINDRFAVSDALAASATYNITVDFVTASQPLYGASQNYIVNADGGYVEFIYVDATTGWIATKG